MCRSCSDPSGGRRCLLTDESREKIKAASTRYYRRGKARLLIAQLSDHGIRAMDDSAMPPTYHVARSGKELDLTHEAEIGNAMTTRPDKPTGALWAAPGRVEKSGTVKSAWTDYDARMSGSTRPAKQMYVLRPQPGAVIVSIETPEDAEALLNRYESQDILGNRSFDWAAMQRDGIDGVYASPGAVTGNLNHPDKAFGNLYAWDASSVAWLSNKNLAADTDTAPAGTYTATLAKDHEGNPQESPQITDEHMGKYDTPGRPTLKGTWDRVPKKILESKTAEAAQTPAPATPEPAPAPADAAPTPEKPSPGKPVREPKARELKVPKPKEYTESAPRDQGGLLDAGKDVIELLNVVLKKSPQKR